MRKKARHHHSVNAKKRDAFIQRRFYTQNLLHINTFTHRRFHTETFFMHTHTQTHFHTETFTRKHFNTQTLLYTDSFTHIHFYMQMPFYRRTHTFTHKRFYTQTLLHSDTFTHRRFSTETFTQRRSQSAAPLGDLSCKQRCANIVAMEMLKNRKSAQDQAQYHDQRTIQCKASAL